MLVSAEKRKIMRLHGDADHAMADLKCEGA